MLTLRGDFLDGAGSLSRRGFLQLGACSAAGLTLGQAQNSHAAEGRSDRALICFFMAGGPSHIDTYDMKPDQPVEVRGPFQAIETTLPGLQVCDLMPRQAVIADKLTVIRSFTHDLSVHDDATHLVQTGHPLLNARQRGQQNPSQGSVISALRGPVQPGMPAYVCIPEDYRRHMGFYEHAAFLNSRHNAVDAGGDPSLGNYRPPDFALPKGLEVDRVVTRRSLLASLDDVRREQESRASFESVNEFQQQAFDLICGSKARAAFDLANEPESLRDRYGRHAYGQSALMARRLVEAGVSYVTINLYEKDVDWWDDHYTIEKNLRKRLPLYDQALATLIEDLHERGLQDRVLVAAFGEFGRAPKIDQYAGRGHWPKAMHAVLSGAGIRPGMIVGSTTSNGGEPADRAMPAGDLLATIYRVLGVDWHATVNDRQNRPVPILPIGEPIRDVLVS